MALAPGDEFAGFTIEAILGSGSGADVYRAVSASGATVALKVFDLAASTDTSFRRRVQHALDTAPTVGDATLVCAVASGRDRGQLWIASTYVDGIDVLALMQQRFPEGMPKRGVDLIAERIGRALDGAHRRGLVHGNLRPGNVLIADPFSGDYRIGLADFGQYREGDAASGYAAPEVLTGAAPGARSDQFALAALTFQLLTGEPPFGAAGRVVTDSGSIGFEEPALAGQSNPAEVAAVFGRAFAFDPADRFGSCEEFADALVAAGRPPRAAAAPRPRPAPAPVPMPAFAPVPVSAPAAGPVGVGTPEHRPDARSDSTRSVLLIAAVALLGVVALTVAVVMFSKPRPVDTSETAAGVGAAVPDGAPETPVSTCGPLQAAIGPLTMRQKLAQLLMVGVTDIADARSVVRDHNVGGIFIASWSDLSMLQDGSLRELQVAPAALPLAVSVDEEGGRVQRLKSLLGAQPSARELAQQSSAEQVYQIAKDRGTKMRSFGLTIDFAPDVDITDAPDNTVIGDRSFGNDATTVVEYAGAYARGLRDAGLLPVLKHFPGHGRATGDSHVGSVTTPPLSELKTSDLIPYRELSTAKPVGVMVGHMQVPDLTDGLPASMSAAVYRLLRDGGYGGPPFTGPVFTDDLSSMGAITQYYSVPEAVLVSLKAGADVALWVSTAEVPAVLDRLELAVASQELTIDRVDEALKSVAVMKNPQLAC